jgi:hypothetical protein
MTEIITYKDSRDEKNMDKAIGMEIEELDYAILKSIYYGFKTVRELAKALKIRPIIVEKHVYKHIKEGFLKYVDDAVLTSKGIGMISDFERVKSVEVWKPIDEYIVSVMDNRKKQKLRTYKIIDNLLLISMGILVVLIIYYGILY